MPYKDPQKQKQAQRKHYEKHRKKFQARANKWKQKNRDYCREYSKQYDELHPEKRLERHRRYRANNIEILNERERLRKRRLREMDPKWGSKQHSKTRFGEYAEAHQLLLTMNREIKKERIYERRKA